MNKNEMLLLKSNIENEIDKEIRNFIDKEIKDIDWKDQPSTGLKKGISGEELKNNFKNAMTDLVYDKTEQKRMERAIIIIEENLTQISDGQRIINDLHKTIKPFIDDILNKFKELNEVISKTDDADVIKTETDKIFNLKTEGEDEEEIDFDENFSLGDLPSLADQMKVSPEVLNAFYMIGSKLFQEGKFEEATCVFQFLCHLDSSRYENWLSKGLSHHRLEEWFNAITSYSVASMINPEDPMPYIYAAECWLTQNNLENAKACLEAAERFNSNKNEDVTNLIQELNKKI